MWSLVQEITVLVGVLLLTVSQSLGVQKGNGDKLIQTGIVITDFNYDQHYGGLHCGTRKRESLARSGQVEVSGRGESSSTTIPGLTPAAEPTLGSTSSRPTGDDYEADDDHIDHLNGDAEIGTRAFGGRKQHDKSEFNFAVLIRVKLGPKKHHFCSGVLITDRHVLTAAHCLQKCQRTWIKTVTPPAAVTMSIGKLYDRWDIDMGFKTKSINLHPWYDPCSPNFEYDVAILTTVAPVPVSETSNRVCLPPSSVNAFGPAQAIGFGQTGTIDRLPWRRLNAIDVDMNNDNDCIKKQPPYRANMICVNGKNFCPGDSGGPLVTVRDGAWTLFGINSIADFATTDVAKCDGKNHKAKFVRIDKLVDWIGQTIEMTL